MEKSMVLLLVIVLVATTLLSGCTDDVEMNKKIMGNQLGGENIGRSVITLGSVNFYELNPDGTKGALIGSTVTDADGWIKNPALKDYRPVLTKKFVIEISGGSYYDASTGISIPLKTDEKLTAVGLPYQNNYAVTPLSHMAAAQLPAWIAAGLKRDDAIEMANTITAARYNVVADYGYIVGENYAAPPLPDFKDPNEIASETYYARVNALVNAAIASEANKLDISPVSFANALADDWSDGVMDGKKGSAAITVMTKSGTPITLSSSNGNSDIQSRINELLNDPANYTKIKKFQIPLENLGADLYAKDLMITYPVLPVAYEMSSYRADLKARGGTPPYTWSLKPGSNLPKGFELTSWGVITVTDSVPLLPSGTTQMVSEPFTVIVTDSANPKATNELTLTLTVMKQGPTITVSPASCPKVDEYCEVNVASANGGTPPYYYTLGTLIGGAPPMGMTLKTGENGAILSGKPAMEGSYTFHTCVVDSVGSRNCDYTSVTVGSPVVTTTFAITRTTSSGSGNKPILLSASPIKCKFEVSEDAVVAYEGSYICRGTAEFDLNGVNIQESDNALLYSESKPIGNEYGSKYVELYNAKETIVNGKLKFDYQDGGNINFGSVKPPCPITSNINDLKLVFKGRGSDRVYNYEIEIPVTCE